MRKKVKKADNAIFTHNQNCGARIVCGRLEGTPSMMALGSTLGTTIDGNHKGAGITKMQGEISRVQYYFEDQDWIKDVYFKQRGLNEYGYIDESKVEEKEIELSGEIELGSMRSKTVIDFDDQHAEIEHRKDQKYLY